MSLFTFVLFPIPRRPDCPLSEREFPVFVKRVVGVPVFVEHDHTEPPLGKVKRAWVEARGLMVELELNGPIPPDMCQLAWGQMSNSQSVEVSLCKESLNGGALVETGVPT